MPPIPYARNILCIALLLFVSLKLTHYMLRTNGQNINPLQREPKPLPPQKNFFIDTLERGLWGWLPFANSKLVNRVKTATYIVVDKTIVTDNCDHDLVIQNWLPGKTAKICTFPSYLDKWVSGTVNSGKVWEETLQNHLFQVIFPSFPDAIFMDLGANIGIYTISAALQGRNVISVEASRTVRKYLGHSVAVNNLTHKVAIFPYAVMERSDQCVKMIHTKESRANFGARRVKFCACIAKEALPVITLDDLIPYFEELKIRQAIMKLDIEHSEAGAILGGLKFLETIDVPVIQMEIKHIFSPEETLQEKEMSRKMISELQKLDYVATSKRGFWEGKTANFSKPTSLPSDLFWVKKEAFDSMVVKLQA